MNLSETAKEVLKQRFLDANETAEDMFRRVAVAVASVSGLPEEYEEIYYDMMTNLEFLPNSPTLMNAGRPLGQLSACFVVPLEDSMHGIFTALYNAAMIQRSGGGVGFNFGHLRPKGSLVSTTRGVSSGPVSFMRVFNAASQEVEQGGSRRGANMGCMSVYHPDIEDFITCKDREGEFANFNISVLIDQAFLQDVGDGVDIELVFDGKVYKKVNAAYLFDLMCKQAHKNGEPGVIFIDTVNKHNPTPQYGNITATNPCGEQPLLDYESCNLGSINLMKVYDPASGGVNYDKLRRIVRYAVNFLNNVIDINVYPIPEVKDATLRTRKVGLGVMGFADLLIQMNIPYGSEESTTLARNIMSTIQQQARISNHIVNQGISVTNATLTTIAPTGSLATIADVSYGIEPIFALSYRKKMIDRWHSYVNPVLIKKLEQYSTKEEMLMQILREGTCANVDGLSDHTKMMFRTATEIPWEEHLKIQAAFQQHVDNAVSKTINLPAGVTVEDIKRIYREAYRLGCKGVTIYRAGSRIEEAVSVGTKEEVEDVRIIDRPKTLIGSTTKASTGCGKIYVTVNRKAEAMPPFEVFAQSGSSGGCTAFTECTGRLVSLALRAGVPVREISKQLSAVVCTGFVKRATNNQELEGKSCPDVIGRILSGLDKKMPEVKGASCPSCSSRLEYAEGCIVCEACGWNKC